MWKDGKVGPLPCMELAIAEGVRGIPRRLYGGRDPWIGWGMGVAMDAVLVPRALKDCGCWNPGKLVEEETQELRDRLSDVVKADPASKEKEYLTLAHKAGKVAEREKMSPSQQAWFQWPVVIGNTSYILQSLKCYLLVAVLDKFPFSEAGCSGFNSKISFAHWTF